MYSNPGRRKALRYTSFRIHLYGAQAKNRTLNTVVPRQWYAIYLQEQWRLWKDSNPHNLV